MFKPNKPIVIAIDGHSSCGKSSFAKAIAKELNYLYVDSGAMYRAVTLYAMQNGLIQNGQVDTSRLEQTLDQIEVDFRFNTLLAKYETFLNGKNVEEDIRTMAVSENVSAVSKIKLVRARLVDLQQRFGINKGIVMDGRDIGTVVYPHADIKLFMTASIEVRASRRFLELQQKGIAGNLDEVKENLSQRDEMDQNRKESPLKKADDAIILDNSDMTPDEQLVWFEKLLKEKFL
ncbi:MAG TPA: (d)CMP kinase [Bacteroidales bacterium]|nr:(d)CMP kinase [Bacteroidales bacterium]